MTNSEEKLEDTKTAQAHPQRLSGVVVGAGKMTKTITVLVERLVWHPKLHKQYSRSKKYLVHDEKSEAKLNEKVVIEKCRPMSAHKNFRLISRIANAENGEGEKS